MSSSIVATLLLSLILSASVCNGQLSTEFYRESCPNIVGIVRAFVAKALMTDSRIAASIIRLHFHDCFVQGCDASILLDNSPLILSEKEAVPNNNSARGFELIDQIKATIERVCPGTVSCADLLTIAAEESVSLSGGPWWPVAFGRKDGVTANRALAEQLPSPFEPLDALKAKFARVGLGRTVDLVALSGGHTFGRAKCLFVLNRLYNFNNTGRPDPTMNAAFLGELRNLCPQAGDPTVHVNFDVTTPNLFDNKYYSNLRAGKGLLQSDQILFTTPGSDTIPIVNLFSRDQNAFFREFVISMIRMANLRPSSGSKGEIRKNCRKVNAKTSSEDIVTSIEGGFEAMFM